MAFYSNWPSPIVETLSGLGLTALAHMALRSTPVPLWVAEHIPFTLAVFSVSTISSFVYERFADKNGFSWSDIGQRSAGIALGLVLWSYVPLPTLPF